MKLFHVTSVDLAASITREGLSPAYARTKVAGVWLMHWRAIMATVPKVLYKHGWDWDKLLMLEVSIPRSWTIRRGRHVYVTRVVVPVESLRVLTPSELNGLVFRIGAR